MRCPDVLGNRPISSMTYRSLEATIDIFNIKIVAYIFALAEGIRGKIKWFRICRVDLQDVVWQRYFDNKLPLSYDKSCRSSWQFHWIKPTLKSEKENMCCCRQDTCNCILCLVGGIFLWYILPFNFASIEFCVKTFFSQVKICCNKIICDGCLWRTARTAYLSR